MQVCVGATNSYAPSRDTNHIVVDSVRRALRAKETSNLMNARIQTRGMYVFIGVETDLLIVGRTLVEYAIAHSSRNLN